MMESASISSAKVSSALTGHADPDLETDLRMIEVPTPELIRPCLDLVLRLVGERWKRLLAQDVNDHDLGARDAGCKDGRLKRRCGRHHGLQRDEDRLNRTGTSQSGGTTTTGLRMEVATRVAT